MNSENIRKWIEALRSDEYTQTMWSLRKEYGYCCLGVACDLAIKNGVNMTVTYDEDEAEYKYNSTGGLLPTVVMEWLGVNEPNPSVDVGTYREKLAELNDQGENFANIADFIESTYLGEK